MKMTPAPSTIPQPPLSNIEAAAASVGQTMWAAHISHLPHIVTLGISAARYDGKRLSDAFALPPGLQTLLLGFDHSLVDPGQEEGEPMRWVGEA